MLILTMTDHRLNVENKSLHIELKNIPAVMQDDELNEFCSLFGTVKSIERSEMNKQHATIQYIDQSFHDDPCMEEAPDGPQMPMDLSDLPKPFRTEALWRNGNFLSGLLNTLVEESKDVKRRHKALRDNVSCDKQSTDENQNVENSSDQSTVYFECSYCYAVADFVCERCRTPYCSTKCQSIEWLTHKKYCAKVPFPMRHSHFSRQLEVQ